MNPFQVVKDFESALCDYTGAKYAVTVNSCTMALLLACRWHYLTKERIPGHDFDIITIPKHTYVGVPMSIRHAGFDVEFNDERWEGEYMLAPIPVFDSARHFFHDMFNPLTFDCVSFHPTKTLGISTHGGAMLHDNYEADVWFRKARFDGRTEGVAPKDDDIDMLGYHCYMNPVTAAEGLVGLSTVPKDNEPLPNSDYPNLSKMEIFK